MGTRRATSPSVAVATGSDIVNGAAEILLSAGDGIYGTRMARFLGRPVPSGLLAADLNDDGRRDRVMLATRCGSGGCDWYAIAERNDGGSTFHEEYVFIGGQAGRVRQTFSDDLGHQSSAGGRGAVLPSARAGRPRWIDGKS